ncbi:rhodanese-like domain-containing protein [Paenibacillus filicis]|uniref:Rhodanese-like domain-containing protein n=1 Tax=Paenibacillus gyeongsangnamensis TaxID=3388067 RepID=A0ABT4Q7Y0_9BACL|nr:rhodanese-like domain-containing protein [Paenibacillus filicis]MCZ8512902.1 rhodanese-like domain-containing protein [Paenibacillus filicis]
MDDFESIEPRQFLDKLQDGSLKEAKLIDVREPMEWDYYHLEELELLPMNSIPGRLDELPRERPIYVVCAHGVRSANVCAYLKHHGFDEVINVEGGMAALAYYRGFQYD